MKAMTLVLLVLVSSLGAFAQGDSNKQKQANPGQSTVLKAGESVKVGFESLVSYDVHLVDDPNKPVSSKGQDESKENLQVQIFELKDGQVLVFQKPDTYEVDENWNLAPLELVISNMSKESHKVRLSVKCTKVWNNLDIDVPAGKVLTFGSWLKMKLLCREDEDIMIH